MQLCQGRVVLSGIGSVECDILTLFLTSPLDLGGAER